MSEPNSDPLAEPLPSRYVVGVDLGTTNSAVSYVDTHASPWQVQNLLLPQLVAAGAVEARETLPSFHYQPAVGELSESALRLPWSGAAPNFAVGVFARDQGQLVAGRCIASAKSWLCHSGVDRTAELLPWHGAADVDRLSPIDASARYLAHLRAAWNHHFPGFPLEEQDFVLTLPASFDEVARELTLAAAAQAGLPRVVLIEEPQAAFYAWIHKHAADWETQVTPGDTVLVCDVGGGTSDFTLIRARAGDDGRVHFQRVAVGEHLILGGDNMDLALAQFAERKLLGDGQLEPRQWDNLVRGCRAAKETLLGENPPEQVTVHLAGRGSKLLGGGTQVVLTRGEAESLLVEGFFPRVALGDRPLARQSGFQEFGLPYAADAAITRNLAAFLTAHRAQWEAETGERQEARPTLLLLNGGVFFSRAIRERLLQVLGDWFTLPRETSPWQPKLLDHERLDLAVARGAAYYGMVRRGEGVRIVADLARAYFLGVGGDPPLAMCVAPANAEPGREILLHSRQFELLVAQPVEFSLFTSSTRLTDAPGDLVPFDREQMRPLPPIRTVFRTRRKGEPMRVKVNLHARLTEIGTLELSCQEVPGDRTWRLQFDVRSATQTDVAAHAGGGEREGLVDDATWTACDDTLTAVFGANGTASPEGLVKQLQDVLQSPRTEWPMSLLRRTADRLREQEAGRRRSAIHEARWLNLLGFSLRPGFGFAVDDWRVAETWRLLAGKVAHGTPACRAEGWILWRRIAGGLSASQQRALMEPLWPLVRGLHRKLCQGKSGGTDANLGPQEWCEIWRVMGSQELLGGGQRLELGRLLLDLVGKKQLAQQHEALVWTLGRLGSRVPVYGPLNTVLPPDVVIPWLEKLRGQLTGSASAWLAVMQLARKTGDRHRDLPEPVRRQAAAWLTEQQSPPHFVNLVLDGGLLDSEEQARIFGDTLPPGLRIV